VCVRLKDNVRMSTVRTLVLWCTGTC